ncbi:MAG: glycosyltransferase [Chloroflexota bacterium]
MRLAFVVQRYGLEVNGGSELLCRQVAEHLAAHDSVVILTTCAQDYTTWENVYPPGLDEVNGIQVQRFPVLQVRDPDFGALSAKLYSQPHSLEDEFAWLNAQGPLAPDLLRHLVQNHLAYDAFIFFTYIYYPTALGVRLVADRAVMVPTAHDEPPLYFKMFRALFNAPRALIYNTQAEKETVEDLFEVDYIPNDVAGVGIDVPSDVSADRFRQKYQLQTDYVLYVGRVSHSKNCAELIENFVKYKASTPSPLKLVLIGHAEFPLPDHPDILPLGFVSDEDKFDALAGATVYVHPSKLESLTNIIL